MAAELILGRAYTPADLLPQAGPMLLLDSIVGYGPDWLRASVNIRRDGFLCDEHGAPVWAGIEYMAQTAAAWAGIEPRQAGQTPGIALLLGTRRYRCTVSHFPLAARLDIEAGLMLRDDEGIAVFDCEIRSGETVMATAQIKAYRPPDIHTFLKEQAR
ncbi:hypothetical protein [Nevskia sp.]|uniref:ApeP family dehydratase n=1 Tax=Nevskia sp. TaxID=1929292 RepID=UPI0025CEFC61|nr:hypothetical protein [Nevskia sp.]